MEGMEQVGTRTTNDWETSEMNAKNSCWEYTTDEKVNQCHDDVIVERLNPSQANMYRGSFGRWTSPHELRRLPRTVDRRCLFKSLRN